MINKRLSLILLAIVVVIEVVTLIFMRGDYRSVMTTGAEYKVPAQIQFKGDFYNKNYLGITIPITEAPWEGSAPAHRGEEIFLKPLIVSFRGTYLPSMPVKFSATWKGCERNFCIFLAL